jgi:microcystin degradation protein MlrC
MRVAVANFQFEGNTISTQLHRREDFERKIVAEGPEETLAAVEGRDLAMTGGMEVIAEAGFEVIPLLIAQGGAGGRVEGGFYREIRDKIVAGIAAAMPLAGVYLALHGAMLAEGEDDPEGDILSRVREVVGKDVPVTVSLDLHGHITPRMVAAATALVGYEYYPHTDPYTTGRRAAEILVGAMQGRTRPVMQLRRIDALLPVAGGMTDSPDAPLAKIRLSARRAEQEGRVLSASYFPVQAWFDIPDVGAAAVAIADGDAKAAAAVAEELVQEMWDRREEFLVPCQPPAEAVRAALAHPAKRVLISDAPDCVGGGSTGDNPALLAALLDQATHVPGVVMVVDAPAAALAHEAGIGATIRTTIGSTIDDRFHPPVPVEAVVESLHEGTFIYVGGGAAGTPGRMGPTAVLRVGELRIVVPTYASYEFADEQYRIVGIDIREMRLAAFKNPMNFRQFLDEDTGWVMVSGAGPTTPSLESVDWKVKPRPFWPCDNVAQPRALEGSPL